MKMILMIWLVIDIASGFDSNDVCYNVTCDSLSYPECMKTSNTDMTINLGSSYCSNYLNKSPLI